MKQFTLITAILSSLAVGAAADVTKEDIKKLHKAAVSEEVILSYIKANGPVAKLSVEDLVELKQLGVGDRVLSAMTLTGAQTQPSDRSGASTSRSTTVYPSTSYSEYPYSSYGYSNYYYPRSYYYPYSYGYYAYPHGYHHGHRSYGHHSSGGHSSGGHHSSGHSGGHHSGGHHGGGHHR